MSQEHSLLTGALDLIVLTLAKEEPTYGYAIARDVERRTEGAVTLKEGSLYPALQRLVDGGLLESFEGESKIGRRRVYYRITPAGRLALIEKRHEWEEFNAAVRGVLDESGSAGR